MTTGLSPNGYVQLLRARVERLRSLARKDKTLSVAQAAGGKMWIVKRSETENASELFANDPTAQTAFHLTSGGHLDLFVRIREDGARLAEIVSYRIAVRQLPANDNSIASLRYDKSEGQPRRDWDDQVNDNPQHPWRHLHLNFDASQAANDLRLPTGEMDPILFLVSFDHWYCNTYGV
jgi:hypothetical protein